MVVAKEEKSRSFLQSATTPQRASVFKNEQRTITKR